MSVATLPVVHGIFSDLMLLEGLLRYSSLLLEICQLSAQGCIGFLSVIAPQGIISIGSMTAHSCSGVLVLEIFGYGCLQLVILSLSDQSGFIVVVHQDGRDFLIKREPGSALIVRPEGWICYAPGHA